MDRIVKNGWELSIVHGREVYVRHNDVNAPIFHDRFVARFKYGRPVQSARDFATFLVENFTPAEYFALYDEGKAPLTILESKGYVSLNARLARR